MTATSPITYLPGRDTAAQIQFTEVSFGPRTSHDPTLAGKIYSCTLAVSEKTAFVAKCLFAPGLIESYVTDDAVSRFALDTTLLQPSVQHAALPFINGLLATAYCRVHLLVAANHFRFAIEETPYVINAKLPQDADLIFGSDFMDRYGISFDSGEKLVIRERMLRHMCRTTSAEEVQSKIDDTYHRTDRCLALNDPRFIFRLPATS